MTFYCCIYVYMCTYLVNIVQCGKSFPGWPVMNGVGC